VQARSTRLGAIFDTRRFAVCIGLAPFVLVAPLAGAVLSGRVTSPEGEPVEHARVEARGAAQATFSGADGSFELTGVVVPLDLLVTHQRFEPLELAVATTGELLEVVLSPRGRVFETIAVSADRRTEGFAPVGVTSSVVRPLDSSAPVASVTELLSTAPAVAENGQGGLFRTYSVRGIARQRVLTLVAGIRVVGDRRAGVSASFVDPLLIERAEVLRGPASSLYGSGALGGVVNLFARRFDRAAVEVGWSGEGDESWALAAGAAGQASWALAGRRAGESETPDGELLNSGFRQLSGTLWRSWRRNDLEVDLELVAALGRDIGKANTDFPRRRTDYPAEEHLVARLAVRRAGRWSLDLAVHPNSLDTTVTEGGGGGSELTNRAFDLTASFQRRLGSPGKPSGRIGLEYFGRQDVTSREVAYAASGAAAAEERALDGASEGELGLFAAWERRLGAALVSAGGRLARNRQANAGRPNVEDTAATGFVGVVAPLAAGLELVANVGTGLRFPSLSERFFSGTTGRGTAVGNLDLAPERSLGLDGGLRWWGRSWYVAAFAFRTEIDDYIERLELEPDVATFVNLAAGRIEGLELEAFVLPTRGSKLDLGGHIMSGRSQDGSALADVPADRLFIGLSSERGRWQGRLRWEHRAAKSDPGSGEKSIPSADLLSAALGVGLWPGLELTLSARNLLDETYFSSADRKSAPAAGRSVSLALRWAGDGEGSVGR
jgi:iron complex outermembrane receptor protein